MPMDNVIGLSHLSVTVFLYCLANIMSLPPITDVTLAAVCPGEDSCSSAIYLTGAQQVIIGFGSILVMPMVGSMSDTCGRKIMLTLSMVLSVFPLAILAYGRTRYYFYTYYVFRILALFGDGGVEFLVLAYLADTVPESQRASAFGIMAGVASSAFVLGSFSTRFLSTSRIFQVATTMSIVSLIYMRSFLPESMIMSNKICAENIQEADTLLEKTPKKKWKFFKTPSSVEDTICLLTTSPTFSKVAVVAFFSNTADLSFNASMLYYLKYRFDFNKNQFADLTVITGIAGSISQMIIVPIVTPSVGEKRMIHVGLLSGCACMMLYSIAWAPWVPYAASMISIVSTFSTPCLRSIASKQIGPSEQGNVQGCLTGICSFANIVSPFAFSPLTALFLSDNAPFHFPGFSIMCSGFAAMIAFIRSIMIRPLLPDATTISRNIDSSSDAEPVV